LKKQDVVQTKQADMQTDGLTERHADIQLLLYAWTFGQLGSLGKQMDKRRQAEHQTDRFLDSSITRHINCQTDGFKTDRFNTDGFLDRLIIEGLMGSWNDGMMGSWTDAVMQNNKHLKLSV
jgi:hypothetical protein